MAGQTMSNSHCYSVKELASVARYCAWFLIFLLFVICLVSMAYNKANSLQSYLCESEAVKVIGFIW